MTTGGHYQAMAVSGDSAVSTLDNAFSSARLFGLRPGTALAMIHGIATTMQDWRTHFGACGVKATDLDVMAQYLDNDRLGAQRRAQVATGAP